MNAPYFFSLHTGGGCGAVGPSLATSGQRASVTVQRLNERLLICPSVTPNPTSSGSVSTTASHSMTRSGTRSPSTTRTGTPSPSSSGSASPSSLPSPSPSSSASMGGGETQTPCSESDFSQFE